MRSRIAVILAQPNTGVKVAQAQCSGYRPIWARSKCGSPYLPLEFQAGRSPHFRDGPLAWVPLLLGRSRLPEAILFFVKKPNVLWAPVDSF